jgi:hypothetical protein
MLILFAIILVFSIILALKKPTLFVFFYVLASTKFLGFFDLGLFVFGGTDLGFFTLNLITLFTAFMSKSSIRVTKFIFPMYCVIACLILWGIINPILNNYESITQAIVASKNFLYFSILFYLFSRKNNINALTIVGGLKFLGIYLSFILLLSLTSGMAPPFYSEEYEGFKNYVRVFYPTYMSLAIFLFYGDWLHKKISTLLFLFIFMFIFLCLILAGHFSLTLGTLLSLVALYVIWKRNTKIKYSRVLSVSFTFIVILSTVFFTSESVRNITITTATAIIDGSDSALSSRERYNQFRWDAISEKPYFGYGFIHKDAAIMKRFNNSQENRFMESLGVVDSGYIDLLVRFGYVGTTVYLLFFSFYILKTFKRKNHLFYSLTMSAFLFQYLLINYTWSVFSFAHGIIPMALALFILFNSENEILK